MPQTLLHQPVMTTAESGEANLWMPPHRLLKYQCAKAVGGLLIGAIFVGWLIIQWSNPAMRWVAITLLVVTVWVVAASIVDDLLRGRGRQLRVEAGRMIVTSPAEVREVRFADVAAAQWREDAQDTAGLWFYDENDNVLTHLDTAYLGDQSEARAFLHWARQRATLPFEVRWPSV